MAVLLAAATLALALSGVFLTRRYQGALAEYRRSSTQLPETALARLSSRIASLSLAARVAALTAGVPLMISLAMRDAIALADDAIETFGLTVTVALVLAAMRLSAKIRLRELWNPTLGWVRQIQLCLLGGLAAGLLSGAYLLVGRPDIRSALVERLTGR